VAIDFGGVVVAIDGPAGAGKSTLAKLLASKLGVAYVDTGAMYRAVAVVALQNGVDLTDGESLGQIASELKLSYDQDSQVQRVYYRNVDFTDFLRSPEITRAAAILARNATLREAMKARQREIAAASHGVVMEGRDIQTAVLPDADLKIFLAAGESLRAERRAAEYREAGIPASVAAVEEALKERDSSDASRECNPLQKAPDALQLCSDNLGPEELAELALRKLRERREGIKDESS
jgi:cytidylate kinase